MHYVKHFNINGIETKQVACIELHGKPNAATEGAVGALAIDVDSPSHDVYKCVAVKGSVYTWKLLSSGSSDSSGTSGVISPQVYGAVGDGVNDDTTAFQSALAKNRTVYVPGGTYKLTGGLVIGDNCELELAQDAVLNFTQTTGNCITLGMSSTLRGHHATINVPYTFSGNVIYADSSNLTAEEINSVPPWSKWDPQWKSGRYVTDINICKKDSRGFHYAVNTTDCKGTAVYISANGNATVQTFMWGIHYSGLRIAGAFSYGIRAVNFNKGWTHEMRIDAFIDACEVGVSLEDCNNAYISAIIQPRKAYTTSNVYVPYAKNGIKLIRSKNADLSGSRVWDWDADKTLLASSNEYQHIAMYGDCSGAILNDFTYHSAGDTRNRIYTDTANNLKTLTIMQEPVDRWFKSKDSKPYFYDGDADIRLATDEELKANFVVDYVPNFTNVLPTATDVDGSIYNGKGYKPYTRIDFNTGIEAESVDDTYTATGFIKVKAGDVFRFKNITMSQAFDRKDGWVGIAYYKRDLTKHIHQTAAAMPSSSSVYYQKVEFVEDGMKITFGSGMSEIPDGYVRFSFYTREIGTKPVISINEELTYTSAGFLAPDIKVHAENVVGLTGGGGTGGADIDVTAEVGQTIIVKEVDENGKPTKWESAEYQPRTHWTDETVILPKTTAEAVEDGDGAYVAMLPEFTFVGGSKYAINYNGTEYVSECVDVDGVFLLGNTPLMMGIGDNGIPFMMGITEEGAEKICTIIPIDGSTTVTVSITEVKHTPIPAQYVTNALPYYLRIFYNEDNTMFCTETVAELEAIYASGRDIKCLVGTAEGTDAILPLVAVTVTEYGNAFGFNLFNTLLRYLKPQEDGTYGVTTTA